MKTFLPFLLILLITGLPASKYFIHIIEGDRTVRKQVLVID